MRLHWQQSAEWMGSSRTPLREAPDRPQAEALAVLAAQA
jgi:hypothetical protein